MVDPESLTPSPSDGFVFYNTVCHFTLSILKGRRICPGRFLAENSLWLHVATTLACFDISPVDGPDGKPFIPPRDYTAGLASRPKPFPCNITPRNPGVIELIKHSVAGVEEY